MSGNFDPDARQYDATRTFAPATLRRFVASILREVAATRATRFLELGIGTGRFALPLIQRGYRVTGIDISAKMLRRCRRKFHGIGRVARRVLQRDGRLVFYNGRARSSNPDAMSKQNGLTEVDIAWQRILHEHRGDRPAAVASETDILRAMNGMGAEIDTRVIGTWVRKITPAEAVARLRTRSFSEIRDVPEGELHGLLAQLQKWCKERFESMDVVLQRRREMRFHVIRFPR